MGGWFEDKIIEEKYLPDKIYPQSGNINGEILEGDQERIDLWLKSNEGKFGNYKVVEFLGRMKGKPWTQNGAYGITWKIQCDCGYERLISHRHLRSFRNHIVKRNSQPFCMNPKHDERFTIGKTFDRLTVSGYKLGLENQTNINIRNKSRISKNKSRLLWLVAFSCSCGKSTKNNPYVTSHTNITREINQGRKVFGCGCLNLTQDGKSNSVNMKDGMLQKKGQESKICHST